MVLQAAGPAPRGSGRLRVRARIGILAALGLMAGAALAVPPRPSSGAPILTRYAAADYPAAPKHVAVAAAADGRVWVGNVEGVLRYAAGRFDLIRLPHRGVGRALAIGPRGEVYVGSYDQFGRLDPRRDGGVDYVDLKARFGLEGAARFIGEVWDIAVLGDAVYFQTSRHLYVLHADGRSVVLTPPGILRSAFAAGGALYSRVEGLGLTRVGDEGFSLVAGGARFAHEGIYDLRAWESGGLLLLSERSGFLRADAAGVRVLASDAGALLAQGEAYDVAELADGSLAVGTLGGEILRFDRALRLLARFRASEWPIMQLATDREGGLWIATQGDLVRAALPSPWTRFDAGDGLSGAIQDAVWYEGARWVASSRGALVEQPGAAGLQRFARVPGLREEVWDLLATPGALLGATRGGVRRLDAAAPSAALVSDAPDPWKLWPSSLDPARLYVPYEPGVAVLERAGDGWREHARIAPEGVTVSSLVEESARTLWLGSFRGAPVRVRLAADGTLRETRTFGPADGLPEAGAAGSLVLWLDQRVHAVVGDRFYGWDGERFGDSTAEGLAALVDRPDELQLRSAPDGTRYAFTSRQLLARPPGAAAWQPLGAGVGMPRGYTEVNAEADGSLSIATWDAVVAYDPTMAASALPALATRVDGVAPARGAAQFNAADHASLPPRSAFTVQLGLDSVEAGAEFRTRLVGVDDAFGPWSAAARREFAALAPGDYTLLAEGRVPSGRVGTRAALRLRVEPAWWQTPWFALGCASSLLLLAGLGGRRMALQRVRQVQQRNQRLEHVIAERTRELAAANASLARLATLDGLTGVANRRGFDAALDERFAQAQRLRESLALLMVDVDHFKQFNDRHGHVAGDEALREVARELVELTRGPAEFLARYGGEEFALVLPRTPLAAALARAEAIRAQFSARARQRGDGLTVSIGVAAAVPAPATVPRDLLESADAALYEAKRDGRDRVATAAGVVGRQG